MFHNKLETLTAKIESSGTLDNGEMATQITDSIDNMNETLESFATTAMNVSANNTILIDQYLM